MVVKVKVIKDPKRKSGETYPTDAIAVLGRNCGMCLPEAKNVINEEQDFFINENKFESLSISLRRCGYCLAKVIKESTDEIVTDSDETRETVHLTVDGQISVISHRQVSDRSCKFITDNVNRLEEMIKPYFPAFKRIEILPEKREGKTIRCCCIAVSVGCEYNSVDDINILADFTRSLQEKVQTIIDTCLLVGNMYNDFKSTFPEK